MSRSYALGGTLWLTLLTTAIGLGMRKAGSVRPPVLDKEGRFWVYKDGSTLEPPVPPYGLPFVPYAWMPKESAEMLELNLKCTENPHKGKMCISVTIHWQSPWWVGVGFVSGPDKTMEGGPWWGKTPHGWYFDLSKLKKKRLVVHMRGERGGERVQWKVGFLGAEPYGDSLRFPAQSKWITLTPEWKRYTVNLSRADLSRVCSLCFVLAQAQQHDPAAPVRFYIDEVYFE